MKDLTYLIIDKIVLIFKYYHAMLSDHLNKFTIQSQEDHIFYKSEFSKDSQKPSSDSDNKQTMNTLPAIFVDYFLKKSNECVFYDSRSKSDIIGLIEGIINDKNIADLIKSMKGRFMT
ncbi:MAG: hypothetical protein MHMPM18_003781 [Marteilia pararefringens]